MEISRVRTVKSSYRSHYSTGRTRRQKTECKNVQQTRVHDQTIMDYIMGNEDVLGSNLICPRLPSREKMEPL